MSSGHTDLPPPLGAKVLHLADGLSSAVSPLDEMWWLGIRAVGILAVQLEDYGMGVSRSAGCTRDEAVVHP